MGLGKTAQSIAVLEYIRQFCGNRGPFLVIAPLSTLGHWQREIETWTTMVGWGAGGWCWCWWRRMVEGGGGRLRVVLALVLPGLRAPAPARLLAHPTPAPRRTWCCTRAAARTGR
jgi:hypothetical protein